MKSRGKGISKRRQPIRNPIAVFHIFCEGGVTERDYLVYIMQNLDKSKVQIKYYGPNGVPSSVAKSAKDFAEKNGLVKKLRRRKLDSFEEKDKVWAVFDRDEHPCYDLAKTICKKSEIDYIYSDPCFELWIALHFGTHDAPYGRHQIQDIVKNLIDGYDPDSKKTADFSRVVENLERAETLAERQRKERVREDNANGNPSTNFDKLTIALRAIGSIGDP